MRRLPLALALFLTACGMQTVKVEPVAVQPIHITVDVNLHTDPAHPPPGRAPATP